MAELELLFFHWVEEGTLMTFDFPLKGLWELLTTEFSFYMMSSFFERMIFFARPSDFSFFE